MIGNIRKWIRHIGLGTFDPDTLDEGLQKIFNDYYVKEIPLYENQEGYWRDLELV